MRYTWDGQHLVEAGLAPRTADELASLRGTLWEQIKTERDRRTQTGGYQTGGHWYHSDVFSRTQQLGLVLLGANIPANTLWKTMSGDLVTMTQALAAAIFGAAAASDVAHFSHAEALREQINAAADPATVDITAGWQKVYGE
jgi:hypothetical protein